MPVLWWAVVAVAVVVCVGHIWLLHGPFDDAYISFRYAENLARGDGLVFNPGERVEGYTCFGWIVLLAACDLLGFSVPSASVVLGSTAAAGTLVLIARLARHLGLSPWAGAAALLLLALNPSFAYWAGSGMETPLFCLAVTAVVYLQLVHPDRDVLLGVACAVAALVRPDGGMMTVLVLGTRLAQRRPALSLLKTLGAFLLLFGSYFAWRYSYYGWLFPNTFYVKVRASGDLWARGLGQVLAFLTSFGLWVMVPLAAIVAIKRRLLAADWFGVLVVCTIVFYTVAVGGDVFSGYRFLVPILPLLYVLLVRWCVSVSRLRQARLGRTGMLVAGGVVLAFGMFTLTAFEQKRSPWESAHWETIGAGMRNKAQVTAQYFLVADALQASFPRDTTIALNAVGVVPYGTRLRTIDMLGLTDPHIGHRQIALGSGFAGHEKHDAAYVLSRRPDVIMLGFPGLHAEPITAQDVGVFYGQRTMLHGDTQMLREPQFAAEYRLVNLRVGEGYATFFQRADFGAEAD